MTPQDLRAILPLFTRVFLGSVPALVKLFGQENLLREVLKADIDGASDPKLTHGNWICRFTLSSDIRKYTTCTRLPSSATRSMAVSSTDRFRSFATSASVLPVYPRNASFLKPTSSVPSPPAASNNNPTTRSGWSADAVRATRLPKFWPSTKARSTLSSSFR